MAQQEKAVRSLADDARDMFAAKWGFGEPAPAYREAWHRDLETIQWLNKLKKAGC